MIRLHVTAVRGQPWPLLCAAEFDEFGGTIGHGAQNNLVLPPDVDPGVEVAAAVAFRRGRFVLLHRGASSPLRVNGSELPPGAEAVIRPGDSIEAGACTIVVSVPDGAQDHPTARRVAWTHDGDRAGFTADASAVPPLHPGVTPWEAPRDLDTLFSLRDGAVPSLDELDPAHPLAHRSPVEAPGDERSLLPARAPGRATTQRDDAASLGDALPIDLIGAEDGECAGDASAGSDAAAVDGIDPVLRAFLEGAGVSGADPGRELTPAMARTVGRLLRDAIACIMDLAEAESIEDAAAHATASANPIHSSADVAVVLRRLLLSDATGFSPPLHALRRTTDALRTRASAAAEARRVALAAAMDRFAPARIDRTATGASLLDRFLPVRHGARAWRHYESSYAHILRDATETFEATYHETMGPDRERSGSAER